MCNDRFTISDKTLDNTFSRDGVIYGQPGTTLGVSPSLTHSAIPRDSIRDNGWVSPPEVCMSRETFIPIYTIGFLDKWLANWEYFSVGNSMALILIRRALRG